MAAAQEEKIQSNIFMITAIVVFILGLTVYVIYKLWKL